MLVKNTNLSLRLIIYVRINKINPCKLGFYSNLVKKKLKGQHTLTCEWLRGNVIQVQNSLFFVYVILGKLNIWEIIY